MLSIKLEKINQLKNCNWSKRTNKKTFYILETKKFLRQGMQVTTVHTGYYIKQSPWLAKHIEYNTEH